MQQMLEEKLFENVFPMSLTGQSVRLRRVDRLVHMGM